MRKPPQHPLDRAQNPFTVHRVASVYPPSPAAFPGFPAQSGIRNNLPVYLAVALGYILLLPPQLNLSVMGSTIPPYRLFLLASFLYVLATASRGRIKLIWPDFLVIAATGWIWLAMYMSSNLTDFFTASVAQTTDITLAYFFARAVFRTPRDVRIFLLLILPGIVITGVIVALESVLHRHLMQPFFDSLVGSSAYYPFDERLGLMRARGPFPHPILAGVFFASLFSLYWFSGLRGWPRLVGIASSFVSIFTVSSAALLAMTVSISLVGYNWLSKHIGNLSWRMFFIFSGLFIFATEIGTQSGSFNLIMRYASLNSQSAYHRVLIWRYGTENVEKNPWFGIGYAEWERPAWMGSSVDHYWLLMAIQFGVIPPILIAIVTIGAVIALIRKSGRLDLSDREFVRGMAISMSVFALGIVSVSIWLQAQVWFYMLLGICVGLGMASKTMPVRFQPIAGQPTPQRRLLRSERASREDPPETA